MRNQGRITKWKDDQGFGFIEPDDGGPEIFLHINSFLRRSRRPVGGECVTFKIVTDREGRASAEHVLFLGEKAPKKIGMLRDMLFVFFVLVFLLAIYILIHLDLLPLPIVILYLAFSFLSFVIYRFDKTAAKSNEWRVKENYLHILSLMGGWPGALIAQKLFRHKSSKRSFRKIYWTTVFVNLLLITLLLHPASKTFFETSIHKHTVTYINKIKEMFHDKTDVKKEKSNLKVTGQRKSKEKIYSWTNKDGKKVFSNVGFPKDETYTNGKVESN